MYPKKVPILALDDNKATDLARRTWGMLRDEGYLYLEGSLVGDLPTTTLRRTAHEFFSRSIEYKMRYYIGHSPEHRGYLPTGEEGDPACKPDRKEGFDTGLEDLGHPLAVHRSQIPWPDSPGFAAAVKAYRLGCERLARHFASVLSCALGLDSEYLNSRSHRPPNQLRLLRYPPALSPNDQGVGIHTDFECFTLLQATSGGLEIQKPSGEWVEVPPRSDSTVVTIGDLTEIITNGALLATPHRVRKVDGERYAFPYFYCLDADQIVEPHPRFITDSRKHYPVINVGQHLSARTTAVFKYLREAEIRE